MLVPVATLKVDFCPKRNGGDTDQQPGCLPEYWMGRRY